MIIGIGTKNEAKIQAIKECLSNYKIFSGNIMYLPKDVKSGVSEQPKSLEETIRGAINRAKRSFEDCAYSIGVEGGLMKVPYVKTNYMNVCACAIYDGTDAYIGLSSAYEYPQNVINTVFNENIDVGKAFHKLELTNNPKIGSSEGAVGILTNGRITRKDYTKQAVTMALIRLDRQELF
jgi:inosine/xanthosine triphosphatase